MSKKTFNTADLTRKVYGIKNNNDSSIFDSKRKLVGNHLNQVREMLGHPPKRFEAPIEELEAYAQLMKNMLENAENEEALDLIKKMAKGEPLDKELDSKALDTLVRTVADSEKLKMTGQDKAIFDEWLNDLMSDEYYALSEKSLNEVMRIVKNDFSLFDDLGSLKSKVEFQEQYMNDLRAISAMYRQQADQQLIFQECFLEVVNSYPHLNKKRIFTTADFLELPPSIQQEIQELIEQKQQKPSER
ncbi:hypothetical protein OIU11_26990 [Bacillus cereus]|uniref:hypothetical protein n=1 Tax=Bacillus cereus TaxID=1396 RepID=UPI002227EBCC|nr:hypothetical protein [Bacillus cereus]UYY93990.1 hypothetical protein OIU11_26990 [Bacillus cereus]